MIGIRKPEDQWSYKRSSDYWPGITTKMKKKVAIATSSYLNKKQQNTIDVEDNVINMYEKYQLHPPNGF